MSDEAGLRYGLAFSNGQCAIGLSTWTIVRVYELFTRHAQNRIYNSWVDVAARPNGQFNLGSRIGRARDTTRRENA